MPAADGGDTVPGYGMIPTDGGGDGEPGYGSIPGGEKGYGAIPGQEPGYGSMPTRGENYTQLPPGPENARPGAGCKFCLFDQPVFSLTHRLPAVTDGNIGIPDNAPTAPGYGSVDV